MGGNTHSHTQEDANNTCDEPGVMLVEGCEEGKVIVEIVAEPGLEQDITDLKNMIEDQLDGAYRSTVTEMVGFQELWDEYGYASIAISGAQGLYQGAATWIGDQADLFEKETWTELGGKIAEVSGSVWDLASDFASSSYEKAKESAGEFVEWADENQDNLVNVNWWQTQAEEAVYGLQEDAAEMVDSIEEQYNNAMDFLEESKEVIEKTLRHKDEILKLPEYIASGDAHAVQRFVDTVLMDIHPEYAQEIKENPNFHYVLELINDPDAALTYIAYLQLFIEAVPPNFYAFLGGKGGAYIAIELILLVALSFLSLGSGTAARLTMLAARIGANSAKAAKAAQKIKKAKEALEAFVETIEDFVDVTKKLEQLGEKLFKARTAGITTKGSTRRTLAAQRDTKKRDKRCRICGSTQHSTPRSLRGEIRYI